AARAACAAASDAARAPMGRRAAEFLAVFATGDSVQVRLYLDSAVTRGTAPNPGFLARVMYLEWRNLRALAVRRTTPTGESSRDVLLQSELTELWYRLRIGVEASAPHRVNMLIPFARTDPPADLAPAALRNPNDVAADLARYVRKLAAADAYSGNALLLKGGHELAALSVGSEDLARTRANTADTRFNVGSMGKMFTAVAIAQLVEDGRLSFDTPVAEVLPDWPRREWARAATIGHLLSHRSGLGNYMDHDDVRSGRVVLREIADYLPVIADMSPGFAPGTGVAYSNSGFALLGHVVERVTGESYRAYVAREVWGRAGMRATAFLLPGAAAGQAEGQTWLPPLGGVPLATRRSSTPMLGAWPGGADGGSYATAADLARFFRAFAANRLVGARTRAEMLTPRGVDPWTGATYGYGFFVQALPGGGRRYGHGGLVPGGNAWGAAFEPAGYTLIALSNFDAPTADHVLGKTHGLVAGY
ncbi:serine hydrolase domain-containing protein, partial [Roseisolibacter sp. H3M3-2]|uniref:serine hydrolase domain-containing protein n=1 Tax=Roseisolibacter sp. H3M3-2 TaxID=3031323 RepID=UPI0023DA32D2